jgi:hypothetical protein
VQRQPNGTEDESLRDENEDGAGAEREANEVHERDKDDVAAEELEGESANRVRRGWAHVRKGGGCPPKAVGEDIYVEMRRSLTSCEWRTENVTEFHGGTPLKQETRAGIARVFDGPSVTWLSASANQAASGCGLGWWPRHRLGQFRQFNLRADLRFCFHQRGAKPDREESGDSKPDNGTEGCVETSHREVSIRQRHSNRIASFRLLACPLRSVRGAPQRAIATRLG